MGAKAVNISTDGSTWYTLPGQNGQWEDALGTLDDTIFGYNYKSIQPGLIDAKVTADAFYKGFAGYNATVKAVGATTAFTGEATTFLSGKSYQITNTAKQVWDRTVSLQVKDNAVDQTANVLNIDYLFGIVTFKSSYTVTGPVTVSGSYFPLTALTKYRSFTLTQTAAMIDTSDLPTMQSNSGIRTYQAGLATVALELQGIYNLTTPAYRPFITNRSEVIIEVCPDGGGITQGRGFFKATDRKQSGKVGELELETCHFDLYVPQTDVLSAGTASILTPFNWKFGSGANALVTSVQKLLTAFLNGTSVYVQYLPDGGATTGAGLQATTAFVSNCTLTGGYDSMNLFAADMQVSGAVTTV